MSPRMRILNFWNKLLLTLQEIKRISVNVFFDHVFKSQFLYLYWVAKPPLKPGLLASFQFSAELRDSLWLWRYLSAQCWLSPACWRLVFLHRNSWTFFSLSSRLVLATDFCHHVSCGIFAHLFSLNQIFVIKFLVSFDTEVERTRPLHV